MQFVKNIRQYSARPCRQNRILPEAVLRTYDRETASSTKVRVRKEIEVFDCARKSEVDHQAYSEPARLSVRSVGLCDPQTTRMIDSARKPDQKQEPPVPTGVERKTCRKQYVFSRLLRTAQPMRQKENEGKTVERQGVFLSMIIAKKQN